MHRRDLLKSALAGSGLWALRAAAVGLPLSFVRSPLAYAADACSPAMLTDPAAPDFLIMSLGPSGDPLNANCPGSYVAGVINNPNPEMAPTSFNLGGRPTRAALPWSTLPPAMAARTAFVHNRTGAIGHNQFQAVTKLFGAVKNEDGRGEETLPSAIATETAAALGTIQAEPVSLSTAPLTLRGVPVQQMKPTGLLALFQPKTTTLTNLAGLRNQTVDALSAQLKATGTKAQRRFLDRYVAGRSQARALGDCLGALLDELPAAAAEADGAAGQVLTAIALFKLNVTPAVSITIPYGGDNHTDPDFTNEMSQTIAGVEALKSMWNKMVEYGIADRVTYASLNCFGRTLLRANDGRTHNQEHHVMTIIGRRVRGGVYGGLARVGNDFGATAMSSDGGATLDIPADETLQAAAKTLAAAVGVSNARIEQRINGGKKITAAIV